MWFWVAASFAADPDFEVRPFAWVQPRVSWEEWEPAASVGEGAAGLDLAARVGIEAQSAALHLRGRVELAAAPEVGATDAFVAWSPHAVIAVYAGQFKVPFGVQALATDTRLQLPNYAPVVAAVAYGREVGAMAEVRLPIAQKIRGALSVAAFDLGPTLADGGPARSILTTARLQLLPLGPRERPVEGTLREPFIGVGAAVSHDPTAPDGDPELLSAWEADLQLAFGIFSLQGEFLERTPGPDGEGRSGTAGGYGQLGLFIPAPWAREHLELVGRFGGLDPNVDDDVRESDLSVEGGVNLYVPESPAWMHDVKLQLAWRSGLGDSLTADRFDAVATVRF
ncbi:MAG: hypothetical protein EXR71_14510 [Myxococcales bacterium]|nr:hypothetical protein [Myxococcales bacterium]